MDEQNSYLWRLREKEREREIWEISKFYHGDFKGSVLCSRNEDSTVGRAYIDLATNWESE